MPEVLTNTSELGISKFLEYFADQRLHKNN